MDPSPLPKPKRKTLFRRLRRAHATSSRLGLQFEIRLGEADYEIRGLHAAQVGADIITVAGTKAGRAYLGRFRPPADPLKRGAPAVDWQDLPGVSVAVAGHPIDVVRIFAAAGRTWIALGTRGAGLWLGRLDQVKRGEGEPSAFRLLPETAGATISEVLFDAHGEHLYAASPLALLIRVDMRPKPPRLSSPLTLPCQAYHSTWGLAALALDRAAQGPEGDLLFVATDTGDLFSFARAGAGGFDISDAAFRAQPYYQQPGQGFSQLMPLSQYHGGAGSPPTDRGVVAISLRYVHLIFSHEDESPSRVRQMRLRVPRILKVLRGGVGRFAGRSFTLLSGLDSRLYLITGTPDLEGDVLDLEGIFSGDFGELELPYRAFNLAIVPHPGHGDDAWWVITGASDNLVRAYLLRSRAALEAQALTLRRALVDSAEPTELIAWMRQTHARRPFSALDKTTLVSLLTATVGRLPAPQVDGAWRCLVHELSFMARPDEALSFEIIRGLRTAARLNPALVDDVHNLVQHIRKFVLDGASYSDKPSRRLELVDLNQDRNPDDALTYGSIIAEAGYDPLFTRVFRDAEDFGEVLAFAPLLRPRNEVPWWEGTTDDPPLMIASTYRGGLWLLDLEGNALRFKAPPAWGLLQNIYFTDDEILLSYHDGSLRSTDRSLLVRAWLQWTRGKRRGQREHVPEDITVALTDELLPPWADGATDRPSRGRLCFCPVPGQTRWSGRDCIVGDSGGRLWQRTGNTFTALGQLYRYQDEGPVPHSIQDVRSSWMDPPNGERMHFVVASTAAGDVHLLKWVGGAKKPLLHQDVSYIDRAAVSMLLWPRPEHLSVVATSEEGKVQCLRIVEHEPGALRLRRAWNYHTGARLNDVHDYVWQGTSLIILGCHDHRVHVLDMRGHLMETVHVPEMPFHRICLADCSDDEKAKGVICHLYACGFENVYAGLRMVDPRIWNEQLARLVGEPSEEDLLRWRSIGIREHELRVRYYRFSQTFSEGFPAPVLRAMSAVLNQEVIGPTSTRILCALIQRLFQPHPPGQRLKEGQQPTGLAALVRRPDDYLAAMAMFAPTRDRWSLPGTEANRKVQLYWIRALLRSLRSLDDLRAWRRVGAQVAKRSGIEIADPRRLLWEYLANSSAVLQYKTLQYLELAILGWGHEASGSRAPGAAIFLGDEAPTDDDIGFVFDLLISRLLWRQKREINATKPYWIIVEVGRLIREMIRHDLIDPLALVYTLQRRGISPELLHVLEEQIQAALGEPIQPGGDRPAIVTTRLRLNRAATLLPACAKLLLDLGDPTAPKARIHKNLMKVRDYAASTGAAQSRVHRQQEAAAAFMDRACQLLSGDSIEDLRELSAERVSHPSEGLTYADVFAAFGQFVAAAQRYDRQRGIDVEGRPFQGLSYEVFHHMQEALDLIEARLAAHKMEEEETQGDGQTWELLILERSRAHWVSILSAEREDRLLADFIAALKKTVLAGDDQGDALTAARASEVLEESQAQRRLALANLFIRLLLFAQPRRAVLVNLDNSSTGDRVAALFDAQAKRGGALRTWEGVSPPEAKLPGSLISPQTLSSLTPASLEEQLRRTWPSIGHWSVELMTAPSEGHLQTHGYLAFGWDDTASDGHSRYRRHRLICTLLIEALSLKQVEIEQRAFVGRFFSMVAHNLRNPAFTMRSGLATLKAGWLEDQSVKKRMEYYDQMYRQATQMQGIIESILVFRGQGLSPPRISNVDIGAVVLDAVKACRQEFRARRMEIHYDADAYAGVMWRTDSGRVYEIVQILLLNALKYTRPGEPVDVAMTTSRRGLEISVTDHGPGVPKSERKEIFKAFRRGHYAETHGIPGLGLGLYLAQIYAEALGGRVQVRDNPGGGSVFMLFLTPPEDMPF